MTKEQFGEDIAGEMLAYPVVHIDDDDLLSHRLHFVVLKVGTYIGVGTLFDGLRQKFRSGTSAHSDGRDGGLVGRKGIAYPGGVESLLNVLQELSDRQGLRQATDNAESVAVSALNENAVVAYAEHLSHPSAHAVQVGIHRGVGRVDSEVMADGCFGNPFLGRSAGEVLESVEEQRVVREDELAVLVQSLSHYGFCNVRSEQYLLYIGIALTYLQSRIVPRLLPLQGSYRFYDIQ